MNWLTEIVRPKIKKTTPKEIADNLWVRCPNCNQMLFSKELKDSHYVCTSCGHHLRLYVEKRFRLLFDDEKYTLVNLPTVQDDPLKFKDIQKYSDRLKNNRKKMRLFFDDTSCTSQKRKNIEFGKCKSQY